MGKKILIICIVFLFTLSGCNSNDAEREKEEQIAMAKDLYKKEKCYAFNYEGLNKQDKSIYEQIYLHLNNLEKSFKVYSKDEDRANEILLYVLDDHPEFYYYKLGGGFAREDENYTKFSVAYSMSQNEVSDMDVEITATLEEISAKVNDTMSDYEKVKIVYDYFIERCEYVEGAPNNQNIISTLVNNQSVCAGYARGMQYALNYLGIDSAYIPGNALHTEEGENPAHAWNLVKIDNDVYYLDATWGDVVEVAPHTCYGYFMMSEEEMLKIYKPDVKTLPTTQYDNYYLRTNTYVNSYDENAIVQAISNAYHSGQNMIEFKVNANAYDMTLTQLFNENSNRIFYLLERAGLYFENIQYIQSDDTNVIEIIF